MAERHGEVEGCLACDLLAGRRPLPGGTIEETAGWAVQPVEASADASRRGPHLQAAMFDLGRYPDPAEVEVAADLVRAALARDRG